MHGSESDQPEPDRLIGAHSPASRPSVSDDLPGTRVSILDAAASPDEERRAWAHAEFFRCFQAAIFAYFYAKLRDRDDAEDVTQGFFVEKVIAGNLLGKYDRTEGRFRPFLHTCLKNCVVDEFRRRGTRRKIGVAALNKATIDEVVKQGYRNPDVGLEAEYYRGVLIQALEAMRASLIAGGKQPHWSLVENTLLPGPGDLTQGLTTKQLGDRVGRTHPYSDLQRMEPLFAECLNRAFIEHGVHPEQLADEIAAMKACLGRQGDSMAG